MEPAEWELDSGHSAEERAVIERLRAEINAPIHREALEARIAALQAEIDVTQTELDRVNASVKQESKEEKAPEKKPPRKPAPKKDED